MSKFLSGIPPVAKTSCLKTLVYSAGLLPVEVERILSQQNLAQSIGRMEFEMEEKTEIKLIPLLPLLEELEKAGVADSIRERLTEQADGTNDVLARLKQLGVVIECTCEAAPVQFEATFCKYYLYFRARGSHWSCGIANTEEAATWGPNYLYYKDGEYGSDYEASWMPHVHALELIEECVVNFIKEKERWLQNK